MKIQLFIFAFIISFIYLNIAHAATIHGTVYDLELNPVKDAIIKINSTPPQFYVSKNGSYSFNIAIGEYLIEASFNNESFDEQKISVLQEGDFIIDLILFPTVEYDEELVGEENLSALELVRERTLWPYFTVLIILIIAIFLTLYILKNKKRIEKELPEDLKKIVEIIKKHGGRTTQKELRKEIPLSEAKISLMIAELEEKGVIKKIKKGRGNILILE